MRVRWVVSAVLVLGLVAAGCGDDDDDASAGGGNGNGGGGGGSSESFCSDAGELMTGEAATGGLGDEETAAALAAALALDPPDVIADDWNTMLEVAQQMEEMDQEDLASAEATELITRIGTASENVMTYLRDECGLDLPDEP